MKAHSKKAARKPGAEAPFAYRGLDRVIHERARLSVLSALMTNSAGLSFIELKRMCTLTDGNLARHMQVLVEAGFIAIFKGLDGNRVVTLCRLTAEGRRRFMDYLAVLEQVVVDASNAVDGESASRIARS